jgi:tetratricopeptide (TPR) repeat protein
MAKEELPQDDLEPMDPDQAADEGEEGLPPAYKPLTSAKKRSLKICFDHGTAQASAKKPDYDYAVSMFTECVKGEPYHFPYLDAFLDTLKKKYKNNKKGARIKRYGTAKAAFKKAVTKKEWPEVIRLAPEMLIPNPWDVSTLRSIAEACAAYSPEFNEVEIRYLRMALDAAPHDADVNRHCAKTLTRIGQFDQAIACWRRVEDITGGDPEAPGAIARLMVDKTKTGVQIDAEDLTEEQKEKLRKERSKARKEAAAKAEEEEKEKAKVAAVQAEKEAEEKKRRAIQLTPRQQLERRLIENPMDMESYIDLARILKKEGRTVETAAVIQKAINAAGEDEHLQKTVMDYELRQAHRDLFAVAKVAKNEKSEESFAKVKKAKAKVNQLELEKFAERCEKFPKSLGLKYQLAVRKKKARDYEGAAELFREVQQGEGRKALATLELGECLQQMKLYQQALTTFKEAVDMAKTGKDVENRKTAMYRAATLAMGLKVLDVAQQYYQMLFDFDPDYKDVRSRLDKVIKIVQKGGFDENADSQP